MGFDELCLYFGLGKPFDKKKTYFFASASVRPGSLPEKGTTTLDLSSTHDYKLRNSLPLLLMSKELNGTPVPVTHDSLEPRFDYRVDDHGEDEEYRQLLARSFREKLNDADHARLTHLSTQISLRAARAEAVANLRHRMKTGG